MEIIKNNKNLKFLFLIIWCFLIIRLSSYIIFDPKVPLRFTKDIISASIFIFLLIFVIFHIFSKKQISKTIILLFYPVAGITGYYLNGFKNGYQESILIHHFLTLSTVIIYFALIESNKIFDYKFKELLFKILIIFCLFFSFLKVFPHVIYKMSNLEDLRLTTDLVFDIFGNKINFKQNINGQSKFLFILFVISLLVFKKFLKKGKIQSNLFYLIPLCLATIIYLSQARFNILATFIVSFFIVFNIKNISLTKKFIYYLLIVCVPLVFFDFYSDRKSRFVDDYKLHYKPFKSKEEKMIELEIFSLEAKNKDLINLGKKLEINQKIDLQKKDSESNSRALKIYNFYYNDVIKPIILDEYLYNLKLENEDSINSIDYEDHIRGMRAYKMIVEVTSKIKLIHDEYPYNSSKIDELFILETKLKQRVHKANLIILKECSENIYEIDRLLSGRVCGWETLFKIIKFKELFLGKGFFADQMYLMPIEKTASNSFLNILFNSGALILIILIVLLIIFFKQSFRIRNINQDNIYLSSSHYFILYLIARGFFEDTLAFVSIDFLLLGTSLILIKESVKSKTN